MKPALQLEPKARDVAPRAHARHCRAAVQPTRELMASPGREELVLLGFEAVKQADATSSGSHAGSHRGSHPMRFSKSSFR